ncbi:MAG: Ni/Fe hydrogenase subunit alpha [Myxococcota bacterium]
MGKTIQIEPVTRIEGHAKIQIMLDDSGNVSDARVKVVELRGFEKFAIGRPIEEIMRIVPRICGVCPWAHHLASAKAADAVLGVDIPSAAKKIRELAYMGHTLHSHLLHFYILAGPDFIMGPTEDYTKRNVLGVIGKVPDIAKRVVRNRWLAQMATQKLGGKAIHPDVAVPGGWAKPVTEAERKEVKEMFKEVHDFALFTMDFVKKNIFPQYLEFVAKTAIIKTGFLGLVKNGNLELYDGRLRMMKADGSFDEFDVPNYTNYIAEHIEPWSYLKFPYMKKAGVFSMELDNPSGIYRTNALARVNVCDKMATPKAQAELEEFREKFGRPAQQTFLYHWARLIETVYAAERAMQLVDDPEITDPNVRKKVEPRAGNGVGCVEAPRGTLIHHYETDNNGLITKANIIVGTTHNNAPITMSVKQAAKDLIKHGKYDAGILNQVEMAIRAYDPCFSCATHTFEGSMPVEVKIIDSNGKELTTLTNER